MSTLISRLYSWATDKTNAIAITASRVDGEMDQVITGLNRKALCASSAPSSPIAGQTWLDTSVTPAQLKIYNGTSWQDPETIKGADIASATTTDIGAATGQFIDVTGTTTITGLGTIRAGVFRLVRFTGALILTHNGTSLLLPTAANITTVANDTAAFVSLGSGNWKCLWYQRYSGVPLLPFNAATAPAGTVLQVVNTQSGAVATGTTTVPDDDTIPQNTEGTEFITRAITPNATTNKLRIDILVYVSIADANVAICAALFQDATAGALAAMRDKTTDTQPGGAPLMFTHYMDAGTTSSTTFKVRIGPASASTVTFNGDAGGRKFGGVIASSITITEIKV